MKKLRIIIPTVSVLLALLISTYFFTHLVDSELAQNQIELSSIQTNIKLISKPQLELEIEKQAQIELQLLERDRQIKLAMEQRVYQSSSKQQEKLASERRVYIEAQQMAKQESERQIKVAQSQRQVQTDEYKQARNEARQLAREEAQQRRQTAAIQIQRVNELDRILNNMELGNIAFNVPSPINIDDNPQVHLLLSLAETKAQLQQAIIEEGEKLSASIKVSTRMEAKLTGSNFLITSITPEVQAVSQSQRTEWKWQVQPREDGKHSLHLTLNALIDIDGHNTPRLIKTFDKTIEIEVSTAQVIKGFLGDNWQWLWAAILVPVVGWLWRNQKSKPIAAT